LKLTLETDLYRTIESNSEGNFKDKGSKFLAFAFPVQNEEQFKVIISDIKKKYYDARHHCYAYRICPEDPVYRINDDGEPSGTAGKPIYGQIMSNNLMNILIVVVRYFGGTLLGTSGLINAYRAASLDCIKKARIIERTIEDSLVLNFDYEKLNLVMRIIKEENIHIVHQECSLECTIKINIRKSKIEKVINRLMKIDHLKYELVNL
jgi:uncharacterized YigZ family protein